MGEKDYDPMMHSAEHLVNGTIHRMFGCGRAFSSHIEKKKSKCDYRFGRNLTPEELQEVEENVNRQICAGLEVTEEMMAVAEAARQFNLSRLPDGVTAVRIVRMGDYDACPCIGTHVANTREIYPVRMVSSDWNDGVLRVRFRLIPVGTTL